MTAECRAECIRCVPPTSISSVSKKRVYNHNVLPALRDTRRFRDLIQRFENNATLVLSSKVTKEDDIAPLITHLVRAGIRRTEIRVRYPAMEPDQLLRAKLSVGLDQSGLTFGADVAEQDAGLARYFITTHSYMAIESGKRHLVIGPKGSGKRAILREIAAALPEHLIITPEHYATDVLDAIVKNPIGNEIAAYFTTWKYTLLVEIFRRLQGGSGEPNAAKQIRKYLLDHGHLGSELSLFERFVAYLRRVTKLRGKIGPTEAEIGLDGGQELENFFKMDELLGLLPSLRRILRRRPFTVLVDELDQSWNNSETANRFLVSLLTAAIQLRGIDSNLHVVVFLRSEIFDLLKPTIAQLDKLRSDIEEIRWSSRELTNLIVSRAFYSLGIDPERSAAELALSALFPGVISTIGVSPFDYIMSRTSFRPRELIQFANLALRLAIQMELSEISDDIILRAEEEFSVWKLEYIVSENLFIYPRLDMLLDQFRGGPRRISYGTLNSLLTGILLEADCEETAPDWLRTGLEPPKLIELLSAGGYWRREAECSRCGWA